jgi:hypothetical protein
MQGSNPYASHWKGKASGLANLPVVQIVPLTIDAICAVGSRRRNRTLFHMYI